MTAWDRFSDGCSGWEGMRTRRPQRASSPRGKAGGLGTEHEGARLVRAELRRLRRHVAHVHHRQARLHAAGEGGHVARVGQGRGQVRKTRASSSTSWAPQAVRQHSTSASRRERRGRGRARPVLRTTRATAPTLAGVSGRTRTTRKRHPSCPSGAGIVPHPLRVGPVAEETPHPRVLATVVLEVGAQPRAVGLGHLQELQARARRAGTCWPASPRQGATRPPGTVPAWAPRCRARGGAAPPLPPPAARRCAR